MIALGALGVLVWHGLLMSTGEVVLTYASTPRPAGEERAAVTAPAQGVSVGRPARLIIPSIAVDAAIEAVNLKKDGSMDVPSRPLDAAWLALGPRPGETGSAAIAGHVDWLHGQTAVFADLRQVKPGDQVLVRDEAGATTTFIVRASRTYDAEADARDVFSSDDGKAHLNIITCDGVWDKNAKQYTQRLVVFADKKTENTLAP